MGLQFFVIISFTCLFATLEDTGDKEKFFLKPFYSLRPQYKPFGKLGKLVLILDSFDQRTCPNKKECLHQV